MVRKLLALSLAALLFLLTACGTAPPMEPAAPAPDAPGQSQPEEGPSQPAPAEEPSPAPAETYFDANGIPVEDGPRDGTMSGVIYNPDAYNQEGMQEAQDFTHTVLGCYTEPAEEPGFLNVHYIEEVKMTLKDYDYDGFGLAAMREFTSAFFSMGLFDLYTGQEFPITSLSGDVAGSENSLTIQVGDASYEVTTSRQQEWTFGPWAVEPNWEYGYSNGSCVSHTIAKVPEGYDGLVVARIYQDKVTDAETGQFGEDKESGIKEEATYAGDYEDHDKFLFFRINGPATPTIPAVEPTGPAPLIEGSELYEAYGGIEGQ